jgi:uncharacterized delta-60 repeat protein
MAFLGLQATNATDSSFSGNGKMNLDFAGDAEARAVAARREGDVFVAGWYDHEVSSTGSGHDCLVAKLSDTGTLDSSFSGNGQKTIAWDSGGDNDDDCAALALYRNGRVVVAGSVQQGTNNHDWGVARLTSLGDLDTDFSTDGMKTISFDQGGTDADYAEQIAVDRMNRIVVAGFVATGGGYRIGVARLNDDGTLDTSLGGTGKVTFNIDPLSDDVFDISGLAVLPPPSNDIVISGAYGTGFSGPYRAFVVALHEDGSFDDSFAGNGKKTITIPGSTDEVAGGFLAVQGGKLLVTGGWTRLTPEQQTGDFWVVRLYRDQIFGDDFEGGILRLWSSHADP